MVVSVDVPWVPWGMLTDDGFAVSVKLPGPVTVRVTTTVCFTPPPLPATVMGYVPIGAILTSDTVIVELPDPGAPIVVGLNVTPTPTGAPVAERAMELLNPPLIDVVTVDVDLLPWEIVSVAGDAEIVNVPFALRGRVTSKIAIRR